MSPNRLSKHVRGARRSGAFTLLEAALTLVILGVGVLAMVDAQSAFIQSNLWSSHAATGTFLAQEIRELSRHFSRHDPVRGLSPDGAGQVLFGMEEGEVTVGDIDDVDDLDGLRFGHEGNMAGPISATGAVIPEIGLDGEVELDGEGEPVPMAGWAQQIVVEKVEPYDTSVVRADDYWRETDADGYPPLALESFPARVTVIVTFTPAGGAELEMARVSWIVP
ncbi:MAG TPA: hypothetical protein VFF69_13380 [Phycisphaerales bacterium]|nr:hypothetical protein [Phycisphaerales bacterium]